MRATKMTAARRMACLYLRSAFMDIPPGVGVRAPRHAVITWRPRGPHRTDRDNPKIAIRNRSCWLPGSGFVALHLFNPMKYKHSSREPSAYLAAGNKGFGMTCIVMNPLPVKKYTRPP